MSATVAHIMAAGVKRQNWINSRTKQNVVLVRDRSGSMGSNNKAIDASAACQDLVSELALPVNKDGFFVATVDFDDYADVPNPLAKATDVDGKLAPISPRGSTNISAGLEEALRIVESPPPSQAEWYYLEPVVLCFTDGGHNTGPHPRDVAARIKAKATLVTVAFGPDADEVLLKELATSPQHFYRCQNGRELRAFLAAVGATVTKTMTNRTNATAALAQIQP